MSFEELPEPRASIDDLDLDQLSSLRGRRTEIDDLLALGLAVRQGDTIVPTNAGILAACPDPTRFLPSAWVQCGRLRGPNGTDIFDQLEVHGPIPLAADHVMDFLLKHAYKSAVFGEVRRRDEYSIPVEAVREVVVNALVHANYSERSTPIRVAFFDDRIQVDSPGLLVAGLTIESMRRVSRLRNPALARVFREAGIMEQWGTGIQRVFELVNAAGLPDPVIEEIIDRVRVTISLPSHASHPALAHSGEQVSKLSEQVSKLSEQVSEEVSKLDQQKLAILAMAVDLPRARGELLAAIGLTDVYGNYRRHLLPLINQGYLQRTDPEKPKSRNQQYFTTEAGKAFLANHQA